MLNMFGHLPFCKPSALRGLEGGNVCSKSVSSSLSRSIGPLAIALTLAPKLLAAIAAGWPRGNTGQPPTAKKNANNKAGDDVNVSKNNNC